MGAKRYATLYSTVLTLFFMGCTGNNDDKNCTAVFCTEEFVSITISVQNKEQEPVVLDTYKLIVQEMDIAPDFLSFDRDMFGENGIYVIFNDSYREAFQNISTDLKFIGVKDSKEVVSADFIVGADCCHVKLISGNRNIIVEQ